MTYWCEVCNRARVCNLRVRRYTTSKHWRHFTLTHAVHSKLNQVLLADVSQCSSYLHHRLEVQIRAPDSRRQI
jgi:hypothetical protein